MYFILFSPPLPKCFLAVLRICQRKENFFINISKNKEILHLPNKYTVMNCPIITRGKGHLNMIWNYLVSWGVEVNCVKYKTLFANSPDTVGQDCHLSGVSQICPSDFALQQNPQDHPYKRKNQNNVLLLITRKIARAKQV